MQKVKLNRVYRKISEWEEVEHNMWGKAKNKNAMLKKAIEFTSNHIAYGEYMMRVAKEWPASCENALTDNMINKKAWIGHAACALALGCPEDITRKAWGYLSYEQQLLANNQAEAAIQSWEKLYAESKGLYQGLGVEMLL